MLELGSTSIYTVNQQKEEKSRIFFKNFVLNQGWKFRDMPLDNDLDGTMEYFELDKSSSKSHTTAKFINIQLKSTYNIIKSSRYVLFDCPIKFLHFCDICDTPVILVVYSINENKSYCLFMQEYIYSVLDKDNLNWRNNHTKVSINIPVSNYIEENAWNFDFKFIFNKGISTITQLRKVKEVHLYYEILRLEDVSYSKARRSTAKILIDNSFAESKTAMLEIIPKINNEIKKNNYHRSSINSKQFKNKECDVVWLFFYNNLNQYHYGLPFCQTQWISSALDIKLRPLKDIPHEIISDIGVRWNNVNIYDDLVIINKISKGDYMEQADSAYSNYQTIFEKLFIIHLNFQNQLLTFNEYISKIKSYSKKIEKMTNSTKKWEFPPLECFDMNNKLIGAIHFLDNIRFIVNDKSREKHNIYSCISMNIEDAQKDAQYYEFERNKIY